MKREDIRRGMKVVPHSKTAENGCSLEYSLKWKMAKDNNQPYLYVNSTVYAHHIVLSNENVGYEDGDWFMPEDFTPYVSPEMAGNPTKTQEELRNGDSVKWVRLCTFDQINDHGIMFVPKSVNVKDLDNLVEAGKISKYELTNKHLDVWFT
jgi:hypothetical protein